MSKNEPNGADSPTTKDEPYRIRLPGFITETETGLGDVIKRATSVAGIRPCGGCEQRAAMMNRWVVFSGPASKMTRTQMGEGESRNGTR